MGAPQITMAVLLALGVGITFAQHGKPKTGTESVWTSLIGTTITVSVLWWGGFWS